ncbi:hypothetical protein D3C76_1114240 [compost metagenome]
MSGVDQQSDTLIANKLRQTLGTAVTANADLTLQVRGHPTDTGQAIDVLRPQRAGNGQGFGHTAEQQDALH